MLDRLCTQKVGTNLRSMNKDAYKAMYTQENLNSPYVCSMKTCGRSSTNHVEHKNVLSNRYMKALCACEAASINANALIANSANIK